MRTINTSRFGDIQVEESTIIKFAHGIPAFEGEHEFIIVPYGDDSPYVFMQSASSPDLAFLMTDPFVFFTDYTFELDDANMEELGVETNEDILVCALISIPPTGVADMTCNLLAPIVINQRTMDAKQIVLDRTDYTTKHKLFRNPEKAGEK